MFECVHVKARQIEITNMYITLYLYGSSILSLLLAGKLKLATAIHSARVQMFNINGLIVQGVAA